MTPFRSPAKFNAIGIDQTSLSSQAALTSRCYAPGLGYARSFFSSFLPPDDLMTGFPDPLHLTPWGTPGETRCPVLYPRYVFVCTAIAQDAPRFALQAAIQAAYPALAQINARLLYADENYDTSILNASDAIDGGELYVAQVYAGASVDGLLFQTPPYATSNSYEGFWRTSPPPLVTPEPTLPTTLDPPGTVLESQDHQGNSTYTFNGDTYNEHRKSRSIIGTLDSFIAARLAKVGTHAERFKKFAIRDYYDNPPIRYLAYDTDTTDGSFPLTAFDYDTPRSAFFAAGNPSPPTSSMLYTDITALGAQIVADAVAFFS